MGRDDHRKKRKRPHQEAQHPGNDQHHSNGVNTSKPTAVYKPTKGRSHTLSIAVPGSVIANCQTHDLKTQLAGSIARAAAVFSVDEVVVFNDGGLPAAGGAAQESGKISSWQGHQRQDRSTNDEADTAGYTGYSDPTHFLFHVLSYLETPPYLRRALFPMHPNLKSAGALPSLDMPHHLRSGERSRYREGVTIDADGGAGGDGSSGTWVDCGLGRGAEVWIADEVPPGTRVTLRFDSGGEAEGELEVQAEAAAEAEAVGPEIPREQGGFYWGYSCRMAGSLTAVFTEAPFDDGYDVSFGTSERGRDVTNMLSHSASSERLVEKGWRHMVIVFGGVAGLESALANDTELLSRGLTDVAQLFDHWVNVLPGQGSRTIRTEEAVWIGLMGLRRIVTNRDGE